MTHVYLCLCSQTIKDFKVPWEPWSDDGRFSFTLVQWLKAKDNDKQELLGCERAGSTSKIFVSCHGSLVLNDTQHVLQPHLKVNWQMHTLFVSSLSQNYAMAHYGMCLVSSPIDLGTWSLFAAVLVQWRQSWCSGRLLQWQHQRSELPSPSPGPPGLRFRINAACLHPAPPGDFQRGTSSEYCRSLPPQACKKYTHAHKKHTL